MAELQRNRTSDATKIGMTDNWDAELEQDIADLIGVAIDHVVSSPIFASGSFDDAAVSASGGAQVNTDGSINGVLRFLTTAATAKAASGVEFQTTDGSRFKLCAMASSLDLYEYNDDTDAWDLVGSLSDGVDTFLALADVDTGDDPDPNTFEGHGGEFVVVHEDEDRLTFAPIAPTASVEHLEDIGDVPPYPVIPHVGKFLKLWDDETLEWVGSDPGSGAQSFAELDDVRDDFIPAEALQQTVPEVINTPDPSPNWQLSPVESSYAYGVSIGLNEDASLLSLPYNQEIWRLYGAWKYVYFQQGSAAADEYGNLSPAVFSYVSGEGTNIGIPSNRPGIWEWELELRWAPCGEVINAIFSDIEITNTAGGMFEVVHKEGYHHSFVHHSASLSVNTLYDFGTGYLVTRSRFWTQLKKQVTGNPTFRIKLKAGEDELYPVSLQTDVGINLIGKRLR